MRSLGVSGVALVGSSRRKRLDGAAPLDQVFQDVPSSFLQRFARDSSYGRRKNRLCIEALELPYMRLRVKS